MVDVAGLRDLGFEEIAILKQQIIDDDFRFHYFMTGTWDRRVGFEQLDYMTRTKQINAYLVHLCRFTKSHLRVYSAISKAGQNYHFHCIICSEKPIPLSTGQSKWKNGTRHFVAYDPDYGMRERGIWWWCAVFYIFNKPHEHQALPFGDVYCPCVKKSCRRGNCKHRKDDYKRLATKR